MEEILGQLKVGGYFVAVCYDKNGNVKWTNFAKNLVVNVGLDDLLDVYLAAGTQTTTWYAGIKNAGAVAATDTLASHAAWTENTNYTGTRPQWTPGTVSGQSVDNSAAKATFAIDTDSQTINGALICSVASGTTGILFCAADFASAKSADSGDTIELTYTLSAADDGV